MFGFSEEQNKKIEEWMKAHKDVYCGAIGGRYTYSFTPTSLGLISKVTDGITGEVLDLSDYEDW